ncbi:MAG: chromosome segregation protein SMC [Candidatus Marsarchaeota archaeon]|nr:chromosome segregation protein SMC [Candidatus Marsarchaeota archaeon]
MYYLDELVVHNFKSFKNAALRFNKGFNCIVGPNGSGKSNICDSLLFALGETSLKRMRVSTSEKLINALAKPNTDTKTKKAYVRVKISGEKELEVIRSVNSERKVAYRLDGKRVTRQEVIEVLRSIHSEINETNTITQDEIKYLLSLSPKGRRELIDVAAGIKEFNEKKDASMRELEKVDMKVSEAKIMLGERSKVLDDLERDKVDAEKWIELSAIVKSANFTLLKLRERDISTRFNSIASTYDEKSKSKNSIEKKIADSDEQMRHVSAERDKLSKTLGEKSTEAGSINRSLEEANRNIAVLETQLSSNSETLSKSNEHLESIENEQKRIREKVTENASTISKLKFEIGVKSKDMPEAVVTDEDELTRISDKYSANYKKIEEMDSKLIIMTSERAQLGAEHESIDQNLTEMQKSLNEFGVKRSALSNNIKSSKDAMSNLENNKAQLVSELSKEEKNRDSIINKLGELYEEAADLKMTYAQLNASSDKVAEALKGKMKKGFYGTVQELCKYDEKYALAVSASAGSRLNYFVVDSIETANSAIDILKSGKQGRASFIPIEDIAVREGKEKVKAEPLLDHITFDKKFENVFRFVFANTFIVDNINDAKKLGLGSCRYVTLDGGIVEPSGVVTGGTFKIQSATLVKNKLNKMEEQKKELVTRQKESEAAIAIMTKKIASYENEIYGFNHEMKRSLSEEDEINRGMEALEVKVKKSQDRKSEIRDRLDRMIRAVDELGRAISSLKEENVGLKSGLDVLISVRSKSGKSKEEIEKMKLQREEIDRLKMNLAAITKENDMHTIRLEELGTEIAKTKGTIKATAKRIEEMEKSNGEITKQKAELQASIESHGKKTSGIYKQIQECEEKISKIGVERNRAAMDLDRVNREINEMERGRGELQTRLSDLKAEVATYPQNTQFIEDKSMEALEKQVIISKSELEKLGNVNLKAPEVYDSKKREVEDAHQKVQVLETERTSILDMIQQLEERKLSVFNETLNTVNENFKKLYTTMPIIPGSNASLYLQDSKDPFNTGLLVDMKVGKHRHDPEGLSGGQRSLMALMLIFAIQMRKPMTFYIFDEIDGALDKENSKKLSMLIKELSKISQFIVVSHNDSLITAADTAIGIAKKDNESQAVGIQLTSNR